MFSYDELWHHNESENCFKATIRWSLSTQIHIFLQNQTQFEWIVTQEKVKTSTILTWSHPQSILHLQPAIGPYSFWGIWFNRKLVRCFNYVTPLWSAVDCYQHLSVRWKAWNTPSLATDWNQRFDQKQQWMSVTFMTWQSVWQQGRGKVKQFNRNSIQPNQPLQNPANATIWLVLWSQPIWFNRRLVRCIVSDIHDITKCMTVCSKEKEGWQCLVDFHFVESLVRIPTW